MAVVVRPIEASDAVGALELRDAVAAERCWIGHEVPEEGVGESERLEQVEGFVSIMDHPGVAHWVADQGGRIVGLLNVASGRGMAELGMMVGEDHRGRGVGRRLIDEAIAWAREHGCHKVVLDVFPHNLAARRLFARAGFVEEGLRRRHHRRRNGELWDGIEMGLVLDDTAAGCPYQKPEGQTSRNSAP